MSSAVAGLLGVVVGALVTGGVAALGDWRARRRSTRAALRLIFGDLGLAASLIEGSVDSPTGSWPEALVLPTDGWEQNREVLAHGHLSFEEWSTLNGVFGQFALIEQARSAGLDAALLRTEMIEPIEERLATAQAIIYSYAVGCREKRRVRSGRWEAERSKSSPQP